MSTIIPFLMNSLITASVYALMAIGFNLLFSTTKFFNLGYGVIATMGGYGAFTATIYLGLPPVLSAMTGIIVASLAALLTYPLVDRPLNQRKASSKIKLVASLGVMTSLQAVLAMIFTSRFQSLYPNDQAQTAFHFWNVTITTTQLIMFGSAIGVSILLVLLLRFTRFGKAIRAVGDDAEVATLVGIKTERVVQGVYLLSGALAGLAGVLLSFDTGLDPTIGLSLLLRGIVAAFIGGIGNVWGGLIGALVLGSLENLALWQFSGEWRDTVAFSLLILFLLLKPKGILQN